MSLDRNDNERKQTMSSSLLKVASGCLVIVATSCLGGCTQHKAERGHSAVGPKYYDAPNSMLAYSRTPHAHWKAHDLSSEHYRSRRNRVAPTGGDYDKWVGGPANQQRRSDGTNAQVASETPDVIPAAMPPQAKPGECYAAVYVPAKFDTVTERVLVREASEHIEIVPAEYTWVDEQVMVKEPSVQLVEVPAQFDVEKYTLQTSPAHATWKPANEGPCSKDQLASTGGKDHPVFCLVNDKPMTTTVQTERLVKGATVREVKVPAEYKTVRKQKLVRPARTRHVKVPAEYQDVEKTVMVAPGRMEWHRVECTEASLTSDKPAAPAEPTGPAGDEEP